MRLVTGAALIEHGISSLCCGPSISVAAISVLTIGTGLLLLAGLWTPVVGALVATLAFGNFLLQHGDPWTSILVGTLGGALALLGPGAWSIDARLFGWKRLDSRLRK